MASNGRQRAQSEGPKCDFCNKPQREVRRLIQGPDSNHICDGCVEICLDIVKEESNVNVPQKSFQGKPLELLPDELGSTLKKYRAALDALENIKDKLTPVPICQSVVYILFHQKAVVYVGESSCGLGRVYQHTKDKEFDSAYWMEVEKDSRVEIESMLIRVLKPKYNNWGKSDAANEVPPTEMVLGSGPDLPS